MTGQAGAGPAAMIVLRGRELRSGPLPSLMRVVQREGSGLQNRQCGFDSHRACHTDVAQSVECAPARKVVGSSPTIRIVRI